MLHVLDERLHLGIAIFYSLPSMLLMEVRQVARNKLVVPGAENALNNMKNEIAKEFGVELGADTTARANGSVGGEMTKRMIQMAQQQLRNNDSQ